MFDINVNEADASLAKYQRALRIKPNVPGVMAHQLGWVIERKGVTEVLVSFRGLEELVRKHEGSVVQEVKPVDVPVAEPVTETPVVEEVEVVEEKPTKAPRKTRVAKETESAE